MVYLDFVDMGDVSMSICAATMNPYVEHPTPTLRIVGRIVDNKQSGRVRLYLLHKNLTPEDLP